MLPPGSCVHRATLRARRHHVCAVPGAVHFVEAIWYGLVHRGTLLLHGARIFESAQTGQDSADTLIQIVAASNNKGDVDRGHYVARMHTSTVAAFHVFY